MGRPLVRFIQLGITVGVVALLLHLVDLAAVGEAFRQADPLFLGLALVIAVLDRLMMIAKWYSLLRLQAPSISFVQATRAYLASGFTNYFLPSTVGSDALRAAALGRRAGLVVEVVGRDILEIQTLRIRTEDGKVWTFITNGPVGISPAHLREHQLFGQTVVVSYIRRGESLVAVKITD